MRRTFSFAFKKIVLAISFALLTTTAALAQESLITSVTVSKPAELGGAYQLTVNSDKPSNYKVKVDSQDSIYFDLKNATTVENVDTLYENAPGIDGVIVQQLDNNRVRIYVNGENTAATQIAFKTSQQTGTNLSNKVTINPPIRQYRSTADMNNIQEEDMNWDDNSFNGEHLLASFGGLFGERSDLTFAICFILLIACTVLTKKMFAKIKMDEEPLIGLTSTASKNFEDNIEEEKLNYQTPIVQKNVAMSAKNRHMEARAKLNEALKYASNTYQRKKLSNASQYAPKRNLVYENYAKGAYETSQKNPYTTNTKPNYGMYQKRVQKAPVKAASTMTKPKSYENLKPKAQNGENIKFLESVTKIYEQNGRKDLAQGLRTSINAKKTVI